MVVRDVEPPRLPIGVGVDELVREVLLGGVLPHLDVGSPYYSGLLALGCGFTRKNFRNRIQWGLIPRNASQK
jgi:hypothetical protein